MTSLISLVKGLGIGAAGMYFFDPVVGRRRRSLLRDQITSLTCDVKDFIDKGIRDLQNKSKGLAAEIGHSLTGTAGAPDVVVERVRSLMGHYVTSPNSIEVNVHNGRVVLKGAIRSDELQPFIHAVTKIRGVQEVKNDLEVRQQSERSQSGGNTSRRQSQNWSPGTQLLAAAVGTVLMANCMAKRSPSAILLGTVGFGLFVRAIANRPLPEWLNERAQPAKGPALPHNRMVAQA